MNAMRSTKAPVPERKRLFWISPHVSLHQVWEITTDETQICIYRSWQHLRKRRTCNQISKNTSPLLHGWERPGRYPRCDSSGDCRIFSKCLNLGVWDCEWKQENQGPGDSSCGNTRLFQSREPGATWARRERKHTGAASPFTLGTKDHGLLEAIRWWLSLYTRGKFNLR